MPFFPIHDDNPRRHIETPLVGWGIIFACVLVYIWQAGLSDAGEYRAVLALGVIPITLFGGAALPPELYLLPPAATLVTAMFLHGGFGHLFGNMVFLYIFGDNVEDSLGHARFLIFYVICGITASLAHAFMDPVSTLPLIGASGAISGVLGAYLFLHPHSRILVLTPFLFPLRIPAWLMLVGWFALQVVASGAPAGAGGGTAWWAHIGGFVTGIALVPFFRKRDVALLD